MNEYILVKFDEVREVIVDGTASGYNTGDVVELGAGTHTIRLQAPRDYTPGEQNVTPVGTSPLQPEIISFYKESFK